MLDVSACERGRDVCGQKRTRERIVLFAKSCAHIHASLSASFTIVEMDERLCEMRFARERERERGVDLSGEEREMGGDEI